MSYAIVTGLDLSELGDRAFEGALEAAAHHEDSHLHVVHVAKPSGGEVRLVEPGLKTITVTLANADDYVYKYVQKLHRAHGVEHRVIPFERITTYLRLGDAAEEIVKLAQETEASEILVGTHGRTGVRKLLMGSVAEAVFNTAPCAVVIVRPKSHGDAIEPAMTPAEKAVYEKFHQHTHGERHTYHYYGPIARRPPSGIVGGT